MLPRLQAGESVKASSEVSVGTGVRFERPTHVLNGWERQANPNRRARRATEQDLASLPIEIERVPVRKRPPEPA